MILLTVLRGNRLSWNASSWCNAFWFDFNAVCRYTLEDSLASQHDLVMLGSYFTAALLHLMASKNFSIPKRNTPSIHKKRCRIRGTFPIPNNTILNTCSTHHLFMVLEFNENVWMLLTAHRVYQSTEVKRLQVSFNFLLNCDYYLNCFRCNFSFNPNIFFLLCSFDKIIWMSFHSLLTSWNLIGVETVNVLYSVCAGVCVYALLWGRAAKWDLCASTQCHFCC